MPDTLDDTGGAASLPVRSATPALAVVWCADPSRIGEVIFVDDECVFGRGAAAPDDTRARGELVRQRPGILEPRPALELPSLSQSQLVLRRERSGIAIENVGKRALVDTQGDPI